mgnify:CR=1 FL=1
MSLLGLHWGEVVAVLVGSAVVVPVDPFGDGDLEVVKEGRGIVLRMPLEGGGRLVVEMKPDEVLALGNLDARRDWGWAGDYARAMQLVLAQDEPGAAPARDGASVVTRG